MARSPLVKANEKIADAVVGGYKAIETGVVEGFGRMTDAVVAGYTSIEDGFVDQFLTREGETVEEAKARLRSEHGVDVAGKHDVAGVHSTPNAHVPGAAEADSGKESASDGGEEATPDGDSGSDQ